MQFTRLRLSGFKSFVDPTDLMIAPGLTGVVGPNGCGKSNLLEALRWVMGENRPTAMRGGGMEDVIFAGAASRPARNFAEVALILDNTNRTAPTGFNDSDTLEIIRRITRDVGSAFKTNGKDARARDVQMLFADASTGAHSPALVRQGQIAELINAKPKARRRILEEAAGISGLYQRRHEAELKLNGAEANLLRLDDVLEQLRNQLQTLVKQARQAARYREIGDDLRRSEGLLLYRRWREADLANAAAASKLDIVTGAAAKAESVAIQAVTAREKTEETIAPLREEEAIAAAVLQRLLVEKDSLQDQDSRARNTINTLTARIAQLGQDIARESGLNSDAVETIERLEWEQGALENASMGFDNKMSAAVEQAQKAAAVLKDEETHLGEMTEDMARLSARHQSAHRLLADGKATVARIEAAAEKAARTVVESEQAFSDAETAFHQAAAALAGTEDLVKNADAAVLDAEKARGAAQIDEADARAARSESEGEANALRAEVGALARLVDRDASIDGHLVDTLRVQKGFEAALGAALADDLRAPSIELDGTSGWVELPDYERPDDLPDGVSSLSRHVSTPAVLVRRMAQIGLVARADGARLQSSLLPGQRLVSIEGDLWRWDGYRARAEDTPSAAALRLQQINRLDELSIALTNARTQADAAARNHAVLSDHLDTVSLCDKTRREERRAADQTHATAVRAVSRAEADRTIATSRLDAAGMAVLRHQEETNANKALMHEAEAAVQNLGDLDASRAALGAIKLAVEAARITMLTKRSIADELRREGEARTNRRQEIIKESSGWRHRLETATKRISELKERKSDAQTDLESAQHLPDQIAESRGRLIDSLQQAELRKTAATEALSQGVAHLRKAVEAEREAERHAANTREDRARADALAQAAAEQVATTRARIVEDLGTTPAEFLRDFQGDPESMASSDRIEIDVARLRRQRDALGAVNLRAEEDAREVGAEIDLLQSEKNDLDAAIGKLRSGISNLNREGRERLLAAFDQVNKNFEMLFRHLFGGGDAKLVLVESDDPLEAGLEIMCQPPGKKLSTLSLLSGGEQTLTALALIFAVFLANPAPICVLDEVDAPLDDANVSRLCDLLDEMTRQTETRFLVITHHAVTMSRMDRLFGVTMAEQGVSQLVSVDLSRAEQLVA